jgi:hypothetical protein
VQGYHAKAYLNDQPVDLEGSREFIANNKREFVLRAEGLTGSDLRKIPIDPAPKSAEFIPSPSPPKTHTPSPTPDPTSPTPSPSPDPSQVPARPSPTIAPSPSPTMPIVAILDSRVNSVYTASQVSSEATRLLGAYFRMNHYNLSPVPKSVQSPDQYMSMVRSANPAQTGWIAQAVVEMHPDIQRKNSTNLSAPLNGPDTIVNLTMNCSVTINLMRLPNGYPTTIVGQGKAVRTIAGTAVTTTARDPDFSRSATDQAMVDALAKLQQTSTITRLFPN